MDARIELLQRGLGHSEKAACYDELACESGNSQYFEMAKSAYLQAIDHYMSALKYERSERGKANLTSKIEKHVERAEVIKDWLDQYSKGQAAGGSSNYVGNNGDSELLEKKDALKKAVISALLCEKLWCHKSV